VTGWTAVLVACAACFALKLTGYLVPGRLLERRAAQRLAGLLTVALLAALVGVQTFGGSGGLALDARVAAIVGAGIALVLRAPYIVVVVLAAAVAAGLRAVGVP
jgi:hypothetical protein